MFTHTLINKRPSPVEVGGHKLSPGGKKDLTLDQVRELAKGRHKRVFNLLRTGGVLGLKALPKAKPAEAKEAAMPTPEDPGTVDIASLTSLAEYKGKQVDQVIDACDDLDLLALWYEAESRKTVLAKIEARVSLLDASEEEDEEDDEEDPEGDGDEIETDEDEEEDLGDDEIEEL